MAARLFIMSLALFSIGFTSVNANVLPDPTDLKAAYCIPIARRASQTAVSEDLPEPFKTSLTAAREKGVANLRRLMLYLLPRTSQLEPDSLLGAAKSAEEDMARSNAEFMKCDSMLTTDEALICLNLETETLRRIRSCNDLSFLPF